MLSIGDFATYGSVSVRMLRHYDALGLLRPAHVDPATGYRYYTAGQLSTLNRIIALRDLGFTLQQAGAVLGERVDGAELRGMLRLRRAELAASVAADTRRLALVEARLRLIEKENEMPTNDVVLKSLPAVRVAQLRAEAPELRPEAIGPVIGPLFEELHRRLAAAGVAPAGPGVAHYAHGPSADGVTVYAAVPVPAGTAGTAEFEVLDLPAVPQAATLVHRGSMDAVLDSIQSLGRWIEENGYRSAGIARERYVSCDGDPAEWVTELQEPVVRVG